METDPVTFLPKLKVHAFLLHDSLVVASIIQNRYYNYINVEFCPFIFLLYITRYVSYPPTLICSELQMYASINSLIVELVLTVNFLFCLLISLPVVLTLQYSKLLFPKN